MDIERRVRARGVPEPKQFRSLCEYVEKCGGKIKLSVVNGAADGTTPSLELCILVTKGGKNRQSHLVPLESHLETESAQLRKELEKSQVFQW